MAKFLLLSVVISMIAVPVLGARDRSAKRGLTKTIVLTIILNVIYLLAVRFVYPRLL